MLGSLRGLGWVGRVSWMGDVSWESQLGWGSARDWERVRRKRGVPRVSYRVTGVGEGKVGGELTTGSEAVFCSLNFTTPNPLLNDPIQLQKRKGSPLPLF